VRILVIDDEPLVLEALSGFLTKFGHQVWTLSDPRKAVDLISDIPDGIEVMISDICMPGMNGTDLLKQIKKTYPEVAVILITGYTGSVSPAEVVELGAAAYLSKPVHLAQLETVLAQIAERITEHKRLLHLDERLRDEKRINDEFIRERMFIRRLHGQIFPHDFSWMERTRAYIRHLPLSAVGGDYVDLRRYGEKKALLFVADVSGHGMPASFGSVAFKSWFASLEEGVSVAGILQLADKMLESVFPDEFYATAFCGIYHEDTGVLEYANAGHPSPFVVCRNGEGRVLYAEGAALGIRSHSMRIIMQDQLKPGEVLIAYTDGLTQNEERVMKAFCEKVAEQEWSSRHFDVLEDLVRKVLDVAIAVEPGRAFADDLSVLVVGPDIPKEAVNTDDIQGKTVLVYDDEDMIRDMVEVILSDVGLHVIPKKSAGNCVSDVKQHAPNVVIMDISMPDMNGLDALRLLRKTFPWLPVMLISGIDTDKNTRAALEENAAGFLSKPIRIHALLDATRNALNFHPGRDHIEFDNMSEGWVDFVISSSPTTVNLLARYLESLAKQPVPADALNDVVYCVREIVGNAIEWGNLRHSDLKVRVSTVILDDRIMIKIADEGSGFEIRKVLEQDLMDAQEEREVMGKRDGGFGLNIVQQMMDRVTFNKRGNVVMLMKMFSSEEHAGGPVDEFPEQAAM